MIIYNSHMKCDYFIIALVAKTTDLVNTMCFCCICRKKVKICLKKL